MSKKILLCKVIGDGQTPDTAYRPAIDDVVDPAAPQGVKPFVWSYVLGNDPTTGAPLYPWAIAICAGQKHSLYQSNPDIDALLDVSMYPIALSAIALGVRMQMFNKMTARGIDLTGFDLANSYGDLIEHHIQLHQPAFQLEDLDVEE